MAGYWPRSLFTSLLTSTPSRSINSQKQNLANIQPSWPHTWSITYTYCMMLKLIFKLLYGKLRDLAGKMNEILWLATWAGKIALFCHVGTTHSVPRQKFPRNILCWPMMAGYCPRSILLVSEDLDSASQYPAISTSRLVCNSKKTQGAPKLFGIIPAEISWQKQTASSLADCRFKAYYRLSTESCLSFLTLRANCIKTACIKTGNNDTKRPKRNHRNERNDSVVSFRPFRFVVSDFSTCSFGFASWTNDTWLLRAKGLILLVSPN